MALVVDASAMLALVYRELPQDRIDRFLDRLDTEQASAPAILMLELFNSMEMGRRRGRFTEDQIAHFAEDLRRLRLDIRPALTLAEAVEARVLAARHGLTVYDAAYLALALSSRLDIATLDTELAAAARNSGVTVFEP